MYEIEKQGGGMNKVEECQQVIKEISEILAENIKLTHFNSKKAMMVFFLEYGSSLFRKELAQVDTLVFFVLLWGGVFFAGLSIGGIISFFYYICGIIFIFIGMRIYFCLEGLVSYISFKNNVKKLIQTKNNPLDVFFHWHKEIDSEPNWLLFKLIKKPECFQNIVISSDYYQEQLRDWYDSFYESSKEKCSFLVYPNDDISTITQYLKLLALLRIVANCETKIDAEEAKLERVSRDHSFALNNFDKPVKKIVHKEQL